MTPTQTKKHFADLVDKDGGPGVAGARLGCSQTQVQYILDGKRSPGMRVARAIEEIYGIKMQDWVEAPRTMTMRKLA